MGDVIVVGFNAYIKALRNLYEQNEISLEQYASCLRRAKERENEIV